MPYKNDSEEDDLFEDDFEFVDDEVDDNEVDDNDADEAEEAPAKKAPKRTRKSKTKETTAKEGKKPASKSRSKKKVEADEEQAEEVDEDVLDVAEEAEAVVEEPAGPPADHRVHLYEFRKFTRTLQREFTSEDADNFAKEFNRTSANLSRWAVSGSKDVEPTATI